MNHALKRAQAFRTFYGVLEGYALATKNQTGDESELLTDLLADLMHFCKLKHIDFDQLQKTANMHFQAEQD